MGLLSITEQQDIKPISPNWAAFTKTNGGKTNFEQAEQEVEEKELKKLMGIAFLQDVQNNPTTPENDLLLNGSDFEDCDGNTINQKGIKYVIAYMVHSKEVFESRFGDTFTGYVRKNRNETETINAGETKTIQNNSKEIALEEFQVIKMFLDQKKDNYPLWNRKKSKKPYLPYFTGVKRTKL